ncbi:MAG: RNA polymerase subunit sigma [Proteobacteria bacterium]|nr:RNA polymerase subunit sigma [Pseudomonadota bacterium]
MEQRLQGLLDQARQKDGLIVVLSGAGISAESGIPTFRGKDGYWTVGSVEYHPEELATYAAFQRIPEAVWQWYLYRRTVCNRAQPNPAHQALVALEKAIGDRFRLITQNVDGLHMRAGNSVERTYQVHGNIDFMRCARECTTDVFTIPDEIGDFDRDDQLTDDRAALLRCRNCDGPARPHVLWFDESYDEPLFRYKSSLGAAISAALILVVGTSASTTLPWHVVKSGAQVGAFIVDINIDDNPFGEIAQEHDRGHAVRGKAAELVPKIAAYLAADEPCDRT